ncbi:hypothetical protein [Streptomyces scabichelini]|nr:hypothetical protein [Streptomyces scabichelini]
MSEPGLAQYGGQPAFTGLRTLSQSDFLGGAGESGVQITVDRPS